MNSSNPLVMFAGGGNLFLEHIKAVAHFEINFRFSQAARSTSVTSSNLAGSSRSSLSYIHTVAFLYLFEVLVDSPTLCSYCPWYHKKAAHVFIIVELGYGILVLEKAFHLHFYVISSLLLCPHSLIPSITRLGDCPFPSLQSAFKKQQKKCIK